MRRKLMVLGTVLVASAARLTAQQLGTIDFPTSAPAAAQAPFIRGVLFLHSFEYDVGGAGIS